MQFVTSQRKACCSLVLDPCRPPSLNTGGLTPVNDKPLVFGRVEPFRCKSLHFSSHTQPHNSALVFYPQGHSKFNCISPSKSATKPVFEEPVPNCCVLHNKEALPAFWCCEKEWKKGCRRRRNEIVIGSVKLILNLQRNDECESKLFI